MEYVVVRVVHNTSGYQRPSGGKLARRSESSYARQSGFGHEEWNFNKSFLVDGRVLGYHYYKPTAKKRTRPFTLYFTTYANGQWSLVGVYRDAQYRDSGWDVTDGIAKKKLQHLRSLRDELGEEWAKMADKEAIATLKGEHTRWSVQPDDIYAPATPVPIGMKLKFDKDFRKNFHETTATSITMKDALSLDQLLNMPSGPKSVTSKIDTVLPDIDSEVSEGNPKLVSHLKRERSRAIIKRKRQEVLARTGKLVCEACSFDFQAFYGRIGEEFCEVHHLKRLADVKSGTVTTSLKDLVIVCSNCHRMLHRGIPMLTIKQLIQRMTTKDTG